MSSSLPKKKKKGHYNARVWLTRGWSETLSPSPTRQISTTGLLLSLIMAGTEATEKNMTVLPLHELTDGPDL